MKKPSVKKDELEAVELALDRLDKKIKAKKKSVGQKLDLVQDALLEYQKTLEQKEPVHDNI